jgi:hypothetical protein
MMALFESPTGRAYRALSWRTLLVAIFALKVFASLALKQTPLLASYSTAVYALLLLLAAGLAVQNAARRTLRNRAF